MLEPGSCYSFMVLVHYATCIPFLNAASENVLKAPNTPFPNPREQKMTHLAGNCLSTSAVSLLSNGKLDTLALWQRDPWLLRSDNENVGLTGSE